MHYKISKKLICHMKKLINKIFLIVSLFCILMQVALYAKDLDILFEKDEEVKMIINPYTENKVIFNRSGEMILTSTNDESISIFNDAYDGKQKLLGKTIHGIGNILNIIPPEEDLAEKGSYNHIINKDIFYELDGKTVVWEKEDIEEVRLFDNKLIYRLWGYDGNANRDAKTLYYDLDTKEEKEIGRYYKMDIVNDCLICWNYNSDLTIYNRQMEKIKEHKNFGYLREMDINGKKYYLIHTNKKFVTANNYEEGYGYYSSNFYYLMDDEFEILFDSYDIKTHKYSKYENLEEIFKSKLLNKKQKDYEKTVVDCTDAITDVILVDNKRYFIFYGHNLIDENFNVVIKTDKDLGIERLGDSIYTTLFYQTAGKQKILCRLAKNELQNELENILTIDNYYYYAYGYELPAWYTETYKICFIDDKYFYVVKFESENSKLIDADELTIYSLKDSKENIVIKSDWWEFDGFGKDQYDYSKNKYKYDFRILEMKNKRLILAYVLKYFPYTSNGGDSAYYKLNIYDEEGKVLSEDVNGWMKLSDEKIFILDRHNKASLYDGSFRVLKTLDEKMYKAFGITIDNNVIISLYNNGKYGIYDGNLDLKIDNLRNDITLLECVDESDTTFSYSPKYILVQTNNKKYNNADTTSVDYIVDSKLRIIKSFQHSIVKIYKCVNENKKTLTQCLIFSDHYEMWNDTFTELLEQGESYDNDHDYIYDKYVKSKNEDENEKVSNYIEKVENTYYVNKDFPFGFPWNIQKIKIKENYELVCDKGEVVSEDEYGENYDEENYRYSLINTKNNKVVAKKCKKLDGFTDNYFKFYNGFKYGYMDYEGDILVEFSIFDNGDEMAKNEYLY